MSTRRSTRIPLAVLPLHPEDRGGSIGSPAPSKVASSALKFSTTRSSLSFPSNAVASSSSSFSREPSPARRLFAEPSSSSSYGFGSPRSLTPKLGNLPSTDPPSPFLVTSQRSPTPYPVGSPNAFATSSPSRNGPSSTPTRTPSRRLNNLPPPPLLRPDTPSTSTGPGTAGCGFDIYHDGASPPNGASSSSSSLLFDTDLIVAASPAPSDSSIFEDYQPDKENKAPVLIPSIPLCPSPLKRRRDLELEQLEEDEEDEDEQPVASTSSLTGSPVKSWKGKGRELSFVPEVEEEEEVEDELVSVVTSVAKGKAKSRATLTKTEGKGKGRAILELEADEGDLIADESLELTPGRRIVAVAVEKKRVAPGSPGKKRRGQ